MSTTIKLSITIAAMAISFLAFSQPPPPPATPIDGGLGILLAGGAAYGLKKLREKRNQR